MSSAFTRISRFSNSPENVIVIEMKINKSDIGHKRSLRSKRFYVTDTETCFLEYCVLARDDSLALHLRDLKREDMVLRFTIYVSDGAGVCLYSNLFPADMLKRSVDRSDLLVGFGTTNSFLNYPISITCHLETRNVLEDKSPNQEVELQCLRKLSADFKKILDEDTHTDVTLKVDGAEIKASKLILRARSPVFNRMFEHETSETTENVISIDDIRSSVMEEFVSFLYTGTKKYHDFEEACELYYAADKYEVLSLREACKSDLYSQLQVGNACQMLILANRHGDESFRDEIMEFIKENFKAVVNMESFAEVVKSDANIALQLIRFHTNTD